MDQLIQQYAQTAEASPAQYAKTPGLTPGVILSDCPALRHNTLTAATRGIRGQQGAARCVCPRAVELRAGALARQRELRRAGNGKVRTPAGGRRGRQSTALNARNASSTVRTPNLYGAPCTTPAGLTLLERACSRVHANAPAARAEFKRICREVCPRLAECEAWVRGAENPPGSWGRIYAGFTVNERRQLAATRLD